VTQRNVEPLSERALERRLKRRFLKEQHEFFVPCTPSFESVLETEVKHLPVAKVIRRERGGVGFKSPLDAMYFANLWLRTGHRVLLRMDDFLAQSYPMMFDHAKKTPWEHYLGFNSAYSVRVSAKSSKLRQHKTIAKTIHDAVLARLEPMGLTVAQTDDAPLEVFVRVFQDRCTLSLNTSGEHLHKRGYRTFVSEAPLRESLAASVLLSAKAKPFETIVDPMCGSGTFLIEEALLAKKQAPGLARDFAFEHLPSFQKTKWERFKREATQQTLELSKELVGFDIQTKNVGIAQQNAARVLIDGIRFEKGNALHFDLASYEPESTLIVSNVPYGERLETQSTLLTDFASHLAAKFKGCSFAFVTKDKAWLESSAFSISKRQRFLNGGLDVFLVTGTINT